MAAGISCRRYDENYFYTLVNQILVSMRLHEQLPIIRVRDYIKRNAAEGLIHGKEFL
jgi:hypothetical protein